MRTYQVVWTATDGTLFTDVDAYKKHELTDLLTPADPSNGSTPVELALANSTRVIEVLRSAAPRKRGPKKGTKPRAPKVKAIKPAAEVAA